MTIENWIEQNEDEKKDFNKAKEYVISTLNEHTHRLVTINKCWTIYLGIGKLNQTYISSVPRTDGDGRWFDEIHYHNKSLPLTSL